MLPLISITEQQKQTESTYCQGGGSVQETHHQTADVLHFPLCVLRRNHTNNKALITSMNQLRIKQLLDGRFTPEIIGVI